MGQKECHGHLSSPRQMERTSAIEKSENREKAVVKSDCCHYWIIDCSAGRVSEGRCKSCSKRGLPKKVGHFPF